jgi:hypothetical protein
VTAPLFARPAPLLIFSGTANGSVNLRSVAFKLFTNGTYSVTVTAIMKVLILGAAAGGGGSGQFTSADAGGGEGAFDTTGEVATLFPNKVYTVVVGLGGFAGGPAQGGGNGTGTTVVNTTDSLTFLSLGGGQGGGNGAAGGTGGFGIVGANAVQGSNGNPGGAGGDGGAATASVTGPDGNPYAAGGRGNGTSPVQTSTAGLNGFVSFSIV